MANKPTPPGRWTRRFGVDATFEAETAAAIEVPSKTLLVDTPGLGDEYRFVQIILPNLPGRDEPLWASDHDWLYIRRPEGAWRTSLPREHLDRVGVLYQLGERRQRHGGTQIGRGFQGKEGWRRMSSLTTPRELDFPYGLDEAGNEIGPMLYKVVDSNDSRVVVEAGPEFEDPPTSWAFEADRLFATGRDGRVVAYPIAPSLDLRAAALQGRLWLRFSIWSHPWADPFDAPVVV
jgi:hypothetical protein